MIRSVILAAALLGTAAEAGPLEITSRILVEQHTAASDGTTRVRLIPATRATPGDRLTVIVAYRNTGAVPLANLAVTDPLPAGLSYRGPAPGSSLPEVSLDGRRFAPLAALTVAGRAAVPADVTHVRWRLAAPLAPGGGGQFTFQAVLK